MRLKNKSIYMFAVIALMCFCFLLFPVTTRTTRADASAGQNIAIKSAFVQVQKVADTQDEEWALMFNAIIDKDSYNALTNFGQDNVRLGMLIGPTSRFADVTDYDSAIAQSYVEFKHVGTASSGALEYVKFGAEDTSYTYTAGIRFNDEYLTTNDVDFMEAAELELTAIPLYIIDGEQVAVVENAKSCIPRNILTESYVLEQSQDVDNIPVTAVDNYAGKFTEVAGDYYVCKSTNRLMGSATEGGDLVPTKPEVSATDQLYINNKYQETNDTTNLDATMVSKLAKDGVSSVTVYTADDKVIHYTAYHAERVITRLWKQDGDGSATKDYFVDSDVKGTSGASNNVALSLFYMNTATEKTFDGLYVLANDIKPEQVASRFATYPAYGFHAGTEGYGFVGTFDGRGKVFDLMYGKNIASGAKSSAWSQGGFFPSMYGATLKNIAFVNLYVHGASYGDGALVRDALASTFENCYFHFAELGEFGQTYDRSALIGRQTNSTFKNVIIDCDIAKMDYYETTLVNKYASVVNADGTLNGITHYDNSLILGFTMNGVFGQDGGYHFNETIKAENLFAVGQNPLFIYAPNTYSQMANGALPGLTVYMFINDIPQYNKNYADPTADVELVNCKTRWEAHAEAEFAGTDWEEVVAPLFDYAEYWLNCKMTKQKVQLAKDAGSKIKINFGTVKGAYDYTTAEDFANHIKDSANAEAIAKFDTTYWNVDTTNGTITWKGLSA